LKRAAEREDVHAPLVRRCDGGHAEFATQLVKVADRPLDVGRGARHGAQLRGLVRQHAVAGALGEALTWLTRGGRVVAVQAKACSVEVGAAAKRLRRRWLFGRIAENKVHDAVEIAAAFTTNIKRQRKRLGLAKVGEIDTAARLELWRTAVGITVAVCVTTHDKTVDANVQRVAVGIV